MAQHNHAHLHGNCDCGTFSFKTQRAPIGRFICHCLFCQDFTGEAFSDVSVLMAYQIEMKGTDALTHKKYRLPPNLNRTRCATCGKPAMETMGAWPLKLVFVPSKCFVEQLVSPHVRPHQCSLAVLINPMHRKHALGKINPQSDKLHRLPLSRVLDGLR